MKATLAVTLLILVGTMQMLGDLADVPALRAFGLATHASPAPKVFTAQEGFETYANKFFIEWTNDSILWQSVEITPTIYRKLSGPYNRRNLYGAAISYGPVLSKSPATQEMLSSVTRYAFCAGAPLLKELDLEPAISATAKRVRLEPRRSEYDSKRWDLEIDITCAS